MPEELVTMEKMWLIETLPLATPDQTMEKR